MANTQGVSFGVHCEVGQLRKVMVCAPGRAHERLTPSEAARDTATAMLRNPE
jgi:arginine deiminase